MLSAELYWAWGVKELATTEQSLPLSMGAPGAMREDVCQGLN